MGAEALIKKYFFVVTMALLFAVAYFHASALWDLVSFSYYKSLPSKITFHDPPHSLPRHQNANLDVGPILSRNPFVSITGPLDGKSTENEEVSMGSGDPYLDPKCEGVKPLLIVAAKDPEWSFAALSGSDGKSMFRRQGDEISGQKVHYIAWDRVWLTSGSNRCQVQIGDVTNTANGSSSTHAPNSGPPGNKPPSEIADKIHKISETEYKVDRSALEYAWTNQGNLFKGIRFKEDPNGVKISGIKPGSVLEMLGMKNGDIVKNVNGFDIKDKESQIQFAANFASRRQAMNRITATVTRDGKTMNLDLAIQ